MFLKKQASEATLLLEKPSELVAVSLSGREREELMGATG